MSTAGKHSLWLLATLAAISLLPVSASARCISPAAAVTVTVRNGYDVVREESFTRLVPAEYDSWDYDGRGNKTADSLYDFTWNELDQLTAVQVNASVPEACRVKLEFDYDSSGRRAVKKVYRCDAGNWVLQKTIKFVYAGWLLLAELDGNDNVLRTYTWGPGPGGIGGLLAVKDHTTGKTCCPAYDGNGNVTALVDADDAGHPVLASIEYSPYGEVLAVHTPLGSGIGRSNITDLCPFLFSTKYLDGELLPSGGLYYYGYRYYDPTAGRWLSRDPLAEEGGLNLYAFCGNRPFDVCDPYGDAWYDWVGESARVLLDVEMGPGTVYHGLRLWNYLAHKDDPEGRKNGALAYVENFASVGVPSSQIDFVTSAGADLAVRAGQKMGDPGYAALMILNPSAAMGEVAIEPFAIRAKQAYTTARDGGHSIPVSLLFARFDAEMEFLGGNKLVTAVSFTRRVASDDGRTLITVPVNAAEAGKAGGMFTLQAALIFTGFKTAPAKSLTEMPGAAAPIKTGATEIAVNPRLVQRLEAWSSYKAGGGAMDMGEWVSHTQGAPWGTGFKSGYGTWIRSVESLHGNSLMSPRTTWLYRLETQSGDFLQWGITSDLRGRYRQGFLADKWLTPMMSGNRRQMAALERYLEETDPGPWNLQPWARRSN